jgi:hypothetical protein
MGIDSSRWSIASARRRFTELVGAAARAPQPVYRRDRLAAFVVSPDEYAEFSAWRAGQGQTTLGDSFAELRRVCDEESYQLVLPERINRADPFDP